MLVDTAFAVPAKQVMTYKFNADSKGGRVRGRFRATGGSGNDIEVYILDKNGYENWQNGHKVKTYYNSGRITVADIDVTLGKGQYILIFSNRFSSSTPKAVEAQVSLTWED